MISLIDKTAQVETEDPEALRPYLPGTPPEDGESVRIVEEGPSRTVLQAELKRPGLVIFSDIFDQGWRLAIDGRPAASVRANVLMRGAAVPAGSHTLVYTYDPAAVRAGRAASATGWCLLLVLASAFSWRQNRRHAQRDLPMTPTP